MKYKTTFVITHNGMQSGIDCTIDALDIHDAKIKVAKYARRLVKIVNFETIAYNDPLPIEEKNPC